MNFEQFCAFIYSRLQDGVDEHCTVANMRRWFQQIDRASASGEKSDGMISKGDFFAFAVMEACYAIEGAGNGDPSAILKKYIPTWRTRPQLTREKLRQILTVHGFEDESTTDDITRQVDRYGKGNIIFYELLQWFNPSSWRAEDSPSSLRHLFILLSRVHRRREKARHLEIEKRRAAFKRSRSVHLTRHLGKINPQAVDHAQAVVLERRLRYLLGDIDEAALMEQSKTWDYDMDRKLALKEFFQFLVVAGLEDVATPAATQIVFDKIDVDGSNKMSVHEIYAWLQAGRAEENVPPPHRCPPPPPSSGRTD
jgi:hypothetical protein